jgi:hypothetical protein
MAGLSLIRAKPKNGSRPCRVPLKRQKWPRFLRIRVHQKVEARYEQDFTLLDSAAALLLFAEWVTMPHRRALL